MRVVLDVNVLISGTLSAGGAPARILAAWQAGRFDLVISPALLTELNRVLAYPKIRRRISVDDAAAFVDWLSRSADLVPDPDIPVPVRQVDPGDDYLIALAADQRALLISGDRHLLELVDRLPIQSPATFLASLDEAYGTLPTLELPDRDEWSRRT